MPDQGICRVKKPGLRWDQACHDGCIVCRHITENQHHRKTFIFSKRSNILNNISKGAVMRKKSLVETNPYLQNQEKYRDSLILNVSSSTAIETGDSVLSVVNTLTEAPGNNFIATPPKRKSTSQ
jgi:hypothetical protein